MKGKLSQRVLSVFLSAIMLISMLSMSAVTVSAEEDNIVDITIKDVVRKYNDVKKIFNRINMYRTDNGLNALPIGRDLTEACMVRAAELMLRAEPVDLVNGVYDSEGSQTPHFDQDKCYEVVKVSSDEIDDIVYDIADSAFSSAAVFSTAVDEIGIGIVSKVNEPDVNYICLRFTNEYTTHYDDDIADIEDIPHLDQILNQDTQADLDYLTIRTLENYEGKRLYVGANAELLFTAAFRSDYGGTATLIPQLSSNPSGIVRCNNDGTITALKVGTTTVSMVIEGEEAVFKKDVTINVTGRYISDCEYTYKDTYTYTENPIKPPVKIYSPEGEELIEGTDYVLAYSNNVEIGTGRIDVTGLGEYKDSSDTIYFKIVEPPYAEIAYDKNPIIAGGAVTATVTPGGGVAPYTCEVKYETPGGTIGTPIESNGKFIIPANQVGTYTVTVKVTDDDGVSVESSSEFTAAADLSAQFEQDIYPVMSGKSVEVKLNVEGGIPPYKYSYRYSNNTSVSGTTDHIKISAGSVVEQRTLIATVTDADKNVVTAETIINVVEKINNKVTAEKSNVYVGDTIVLNSQVSGGVDPNTVEYHLSTVSGTLLESDGTVCYYTPETEGTYTFYSVATDAHGNNCSSYTKVTVKKRPTVELQAVSSRIQLGERASFKTVLTGGYSAFIYQYECVTHGDISLTGTTSTYFTPTETGTYRVKVTVTDSLGTEVTDYADVEVADKLAVQLVSDANLDMAYVGDKVTFTANTNGGFEPYTYLFTDKTGAEIPANGDFFVYSCDSIIDEKITVKVVDDAKRGVSAYKTLKVAEPFSVELTADKDHILEGTSVKITSVPHGGFSTYSYSYTINDEPYTSTSASFSYAFKTEGQYNIKVTAKDKKGTEREDEITVYVAPKLTISTQVDKLYVHTGKTAPIVALAQGGFDEEYTYSFTVNGEAVQADDNIYNFKPTASGSYVITAKVEDKYGFTASISNTFKAEPELSVSLEASKNKVLIGEKVTLTTLTEGGFTPFKFAYTYSNGTKISGTSAAISLTPSAADDYTIVVNVTDASGDVKTAEVPLSVANKLNLVTEASAEAVFRGDSAEFTATLTGGFPDYLYVFTYGENVTIPSQNNKAVLTPNENGEYVVTITASDSEGNSLTQTKTIKVADKLLFEVSTSQTEFVVGDSAVFTNTLSGGFEPVKVTYSVTNGGSVSVVNGIGTFKPSRAGDYVVTVTATDYYKHTVPVEIPIKVVDKLSVSLKADNQNVFVGQSAVLTANVNGGFAPYTYEFTTDEGDYLGSGDSQFEFVPEEVGSTPINVTVTDSKGSTATSRIIVSAAIPFDAEWDTFTDHIPLGSKVTLKALPIGGYPSYSYKYTNGDGASVGTSQTYSFTPAETGEYTIKCNVSDKYKNTKELSTVIYVADKINVTMTASTLEANPGESITFTAQGSGGFGSIKYTFKTDSGIISTGSSNTAQLSATKTGTYTENVTVIAEDEFGLTASYTLKVGFIGKLSVQFTPYPARILKGQSCKFTALATGGISPYTYSYSYVGDDTPITSTSSSVSISPKTTGFTTVKVIVKDSTGENVEEATAAVEVADTLALTVTQSAAMAYYGEKVTLTANISGGYGGYTYIFTDSQNNVIEGTGNTRTVSYSEDGTYSVKVTVKDEAGYSTNKTVSIKVCEEPKVSLSASAATLNVNENVTLTTTVTGGFSTYTYKYAYDDGTAIAGTSATKTITPNIPGDYTVIVTVTDKKGTVKTAQASFTVFGPLTALLSANTDYAAVGSDVTFTAKAVGGKGSYSYEFTDKDGNKLTSNGTACVLKATETGSITVNVKITDGENSVSTATKTVTVSKPMTITFKPSVDEAMAGVAFKLITTVSDGFPTYTYSVKDQTGKVIGTSNSVSVTAKKIGTYVYTVEVKDKSGYVKTAEASVVVKTDLDVALVPSKRIGYGNDATITVTANASGGGSSKTYKYTVNGEEVDETSNAITVGPGFGTYDIGVTVTDSNGNSVTNETTVYIKDCEEFVNNTTIAANEVQAGKTLKITAACTGGVGPYVYNYQYKKSSNTSWRTIGDKNTASTTASFKVTSTGEYDIRVIAKDSYSYNGESVPSAATEVFKVTVTPAYNDLQNNSTIALTTAPRGTNIKISGKAAEGKAPYLYTYQYKLASTTAWKTIGTANGSDTYQIFTPQKVGEYDVRVIIKDSLDTTKSKSFKVDCIEGAELTNTSFLSATTVAEGETVTIAAKATGGAMPYLYTAQYKKSTETSWKTIGEKSSTSGNFTFTPGNAGDYDIRVIVKDNAGDAASSNLSIVVTENDFKPLANTSKLSASTFTPGDTINVSGSATGGKEPYYYTVQYRKESVTTWSTSGTRNSTSGTRSIKLSANENYRIRVIIKDAQGTTKTKNFTVTVK